MPGPGQGMRRPRRRGPRKGSEIGRTGRGEGRAGVDTCFSFFFFLGSPLFWSRLGDRPTAQEWGWVGRAGSSNRGKERGRGGGQLTSR